jgi:hypothetical protein
VNEETAIHWVAVSFFFEDSGRVCLKMGEEDGTSGQCRNPLVAWKGVARKESTMSQQNRINFSNNVAIPR